MMNLLRRKEKNMKDDIVTGQGNAVELVLMRKNSIVRVTTNDT